MSRIEFIILCILLLVGLVARIFWYFQHQPQYQDGQTLLLQVQLTTEPELSNKGQQFTIKTNDNQAIYVKTSVGVRYHYGDILAIQGSLQVQKSENGHEFLHLNFPKIQKKNVSKNPLVNASIFVRRESSALFERELPPISSSLFLGIVFGAKENFPDDFKNHLKSTGVLHVIAASGMNVSFFTGAVLFSLGTFLKRRFAIICSVFAVIFYSFLVGFESSIIRASIMALIAFAASFLGRQKLGIWALCVTGYVMLLWQPNFIIDVGFQLSFMATLGILLLNTRLGFISRLGPLAEDIKTTISAEIATLPILLSTFGQVGVFSLVVNALVLWTVPILMFLGSVAVIVGLCIPQLGSLFLLLSLPFLLYFEWIVNVFGSLGWNITIDSFPGQLVLGYYLVLGAYLFLGRRNDDSRIVKVQK
jgi:ComEC/Rec2-related protein